MLIAGMFCCCYCFCCWLFLYTCTYVRTCCAPQTAHEFNMLAFNFDCCHFCTVVTAIALLQLLLQLLLVLLLWFCFYDDCCYTCAATFYQSVGAFVWRPVSFGRSVCTHGMFVCVCVYMCVCMSVCMYVYLSVGLSSCLSTAVWGLRSDLFRVFTQFPFSLFFLSFAFG